ncbi:MAG: hypothetical protein U5L07_01185 [Desulfobacterales bacterium]|nr:hypothetical protein [Desulfobacterales bacterium]
MIAVNGTGQALQSTALRRGTGLLFGVCRAFGQIRGKFRTEPGHPGLRQGDAEMQGRGELQAVKPSAPGLHEIIDMKDIQGE